RLFHVVERVAQLLGTPTGRKAAQGAGLVVKPVAAKLERPQQPAGCLAARPGGVPHPHRLGRGR
ncbi:hypothetical protein GTV15_02210, partial [Streptomyces sp. SID7803]|nr:hypothetical protein [Streptomyces sp. SID7803]